MTTVMLTEYQQALLAAARVFAWRWMTTDHLIAAAQRRTAGRWRRYRRLLDQFEATGVVDRDDRGTGRDYWRLRLDGVGAVEADGLPPVMTSAPSACPECGLTSTIHALMAHGATCG